MSTRVLVRAMQCDAKRKYPLVSTGASDSLTESGHKSRKGTRACLHLVPDDVLARPEVAGDGERVDVVVRVELVGRRPLAVGGLARLGDLKPHLPV